MIDHAIKYIEKGLPIFPCHWIEDGHCSCGDPECRNAGKHPYAPLVPRGFHQATTVESVIRHWWKKAPLANIGLRTGNGVLVVDIDNKIGKDGEASLREWEHKYGALPPTPTVYTGGGGTHYYLRYDPNINIPSGTNLLGVGVDIRANGGYVIAPPSTHKSGQPYTWDLDADLDTEIANAPANLIAQLCKDSKPVEFKTISTGSLSDDEVYDIRKALRFIPADDRDTWIKVGQALHATNAYPANFGLWEEWSKNSDKYNAKDQHRVWRSFTPEKGITLGTLFHIASEYGYLPFGKEESNLVDLTPYFNGESIVEDSAPSTPDYLLSIPGILGEAVDWVNATSYRLQPEFAVQTALAIGANAIARCYVTDNRNYSPLYLLNIGPSGCGKEHAKTCIERVFIAANLQHLVNGAGYTSDSAVISALVNNPSHLTIIDEFGMVLNTIKAQGNYTGASVVPSLMEIWGRCAGLTQPKQYATMHLSKEQQDAMKQRIIYNPCLSLLGITTPKTFYDALSGKDIASGLLGRILICETPHGRVPARIPIDCDPPVDVVNWVKYMRKGDESYTPATHSIPCNPKMIRFDDEARRLTQKLDEDVMSWQDELEHQGLDDLVGRVREIAMRISLIVALSRDAITETITASDFIWARDYTLFHFNYLVNQIPKYMTESKHDAKCQELLQLVVKHGKGGLTKTQICNSSFAKKYTKKEREEAIKELEELGRIHVIIDEGQDGKRNTWKIQLA